MAEWPASVMEGDYARTAACEARASKAFTSMGGATVPANVSRVAIRVDASTRIGTGHVSRCLTLADTLARRGAAVEFIGRVLDGALHDMVEERGYRVRRLPRDGRTPTTTDLAAPHAAWLETDWHTDAEQTIAALAEGTQRPSWLIVDHYALDARWQSRLRPHVGRILAIDDLADRPHVAEVLLDQNYAANQDRYTGLLPRSSRVLQGPRYAVVSDVYRDARAALSPREGRCARWNVFFGGVDLTNETCKALNAMTASRWREMPVDVVVGAGNPHRAAIDEALRSLPNATLHVQVPHLAALFAAADLAVGAGGTSTWERCCLGVPSVLVATATNQMPTLEALAAHDYIDYLGPHERVSVRDYRRAFEVADDAQRLHDLSRRCMDLVDGDGAGRVADAMGFGDPLGRPTVSRA